MELAPFVSIPEGHRADDVKMPRCRQTCSFFGIRLKPDRAEPRNRLQAAVRLTDSPPGSDIVKNWRGNPSDCKLPASLFESPVGAPSVGMGADKTAQGFERIHSADEQLKPKMQIASREGPRLAIPSSFTKSP